MKRFILILAIALLLVTAVVPVALAGTDPRCGRVWACIAADGGGWASPSIARR
jgi:hypothetical protein